MSELNNYTAEELQYFETEMRKYRLPLICKIWKKYGLKALSYSILPAFILIAVLGIIYSNSPYGQYDWMWVVDKTIILTYIIGFGLFALVSHFLESYSANKLRKRLGLNQNDFNLLIVANDITGM